MGEGLGTLELDTEWGEERVSGVQRWRRASNLQTLGKYVDIYPAALTMYSRLPPQMHSHRIRESHCSGREFQYSTGTKPVSLINWKLQILASIRFGPAADP